jgi:hypothetical protein
VITSKNGPVPLLNSGTSPGLNGVAQNCDGESNQATLSSTAENTTGTSTSKERPNDEYRRVAIPPSLLLTLASNPSNVITSENGPVPLLNSGTSLISARNNYIMHFIYISYQHFRYRNFIMLFQETETARITCAWGMEKELTQHFGNPFGEFCCTPTLKGQLTCDHDGCDAKVHRDCQWMWLKRARLPVETRSPVYCPKHNGQRGDYIRSYYKYRRVAIPPSLLLTLASNPSNVITSENGPVPLLNSGTSPGLNGVAQKCDGESNQTTLSSTAENTTGTSTSEERPNEA